MGRDGRTYLFSGDQFVSYAGESYTDAEIDGDPQPIAAHWGGLTSVTLAYVRDGKTYLFEPPDEDGIMQYLVYSGRDYRQPDAGFPQRADAAFWGIPEDHQATFAQVDAVLVQGPTTLLLSGEQCLVLDEETGHWSYPRPIGRLWRGFPFGDSFGDLPEGPDGQTAPAGLTTAFTGADGATYFFSRDRFTRYDGRAFSPPRPVRDVWGRARNNFVAAGHRTQVDAAFVDRGTTTFLFSGDQYVRYSGPDYRHVDAGYPKPILANLRTEGVFAALPDSFEDVVADRIAAGADPVIDAVVGNGRSVYVFLGADCHVASRAVAADYELAQTVGHVRNTLAGRHRVDAALVTGEHTFLFSGDQYVRYTGDQYGFVDEGYPRTLATSLPAELGFSVLPEPFSDRIDAAVLGADGVTYLFTADQYLPVDPAVQAAPAPRPVTGTWGKVRNRFTADPADTAVDAAFCSPAGELYVFKDGQYLRYASPRQEYADEGFPRSVRGNWGDLPAPFEAAVDGACVLDGRAYLFSGQTYVRYSGASYHAVDRMYPQPFGQRWAPWADYLLTDVRTVTGFKQLADTYPGDAGGLAGFLDSDQAAVPDPYRVLGLFGWDADELRWLRRQHGFLPGPSQFEEGFEIEFVAAAVDLFAMAGRLGAGPSAVFEQVWSPLYAGDPAAPGSAGLDAAADALQALLLAKQSEPDRPVLVRQLHDETNLLRRDALVAAVMGRDDTLRTARDVFERLLIDVEMGSAGLTSRVREALAATQLYYHRYFLGLEPAAAPAAGTRPGSGKSSRHGGPGCRTTGSGKPTGRCSSTRRTTSGRSSAPPRRRRSRPPERPHAGRDHPPGGAARLPEVPRRVHRGLPSHARRGLRVRPAGFPRGGAPAGAVRGHENRPAAVLLPVLGLPGRRRALRHVVTVGRRQRADRRGQGLPGVRLRPGLRVLGEDRDGHGQRRRRGGRRSQHGSHRPDQGRHPACFRGAQTVLRGPGLLLLLQPQHGMGAGPGPRCGHQPDQHHGPPAACRAVRGPADDGHQRLLITCSYTAAGAAVGPSSASLPS